ncbi:hypothetical protein AAAY27_17515 [Bacteroides thetaiotaomicron]|jgi:hypothetical protein|uniref:hypothetical protein n=1 Tax=Bacteroidales TaxID=171549 RepID=UPI001E3F6A34|nr:MULTISPECIES: hypothetical protein [Bacteroidales]DAY52893.1 MAG TPA: hypothetical protein [Caudoviricetes sp.]MCS2244557.1 hypothetical protein [Bacteroides thetaiotaomicron]MCS2910071.1 hypothetical protein [Bacteroides thetaiotaomicron]MDC2097389.1 hypothetical protein [Bacteroides thetaiotaomicron]MDC2117918.1 hypothetical protein [Bacteroides thetaiotaomicron]
MVNDFSIIEQIKLVKEKKEKLSRIEQNLSSPILTDKSLIPEIYELFKRVLSEQDFSPMPESPHQRKKFVFVILFLYSPKTLAGYHSPRGLRDAIAKAIGLRDVTFISNNIETVAFLSQNDKYFKEDIEYLYTEIITRLKIKGLIN